MKETGASFFIKPSKAAYEHLNPNRFALGLVPLKPLLFKEAVNTIPASLGWYDWMARLDLWAGPLIKSYAKSLTKWVTGKKKKTVKK